jgi:hypothetical protein
MDKCQTDQEYIDEFGHMMDDIGFMISTILGIDMDWEKKNIEQG